jgi:hypothetical protein
MPYFSIKNLSSPDVTATYDDPLDALAHARSNCPQHKDKEDRRKWLTNPKTDSACILLFEGLNPSLRVSVAKGNPVAVVHGIITDYDANAPGSFADQINHVRDFYSKTPAITPQWIQRTFSGNFRLIWEFSEPCSFQGCADMFFPEFMHEFVKLVRASSVLAGMDTSCLTKPSTYYDALGDWEPINPNPFPATDVDGVFFAAVRKFSKSNAAVGSGAEIPMEAILARLEELFPGRWPVDIPFTDGCRGPAVWDDTASNPTSTIYTTTGAYRFSSAKGFHPYEEILGRDFVRQWQDNKLGQVGKHFYYLPGSGRYYARLRDHWEPQTVTDVQRRLVNDWSLSRKAAGHTSCSEVEQAIQHIQDTRKIDGLLPFIFSKKETHVLNRKIFLNVARVLVLEPSPEDQTKRHINAKRKSPYRWGDGFPWIAEWLGSWFNDPPRQLIYLLCWIKQAYESAREGDPQKGQALFLVGGVSRGKSLFNGPDFMGSIFGYSVDAADYLVGGDAFNKELLEAGYWRVDDAQAAVNRESHSKFTERVKSFVANSTLTYHPKYVDKQTVPYAGRLCVTLNEDDESLRMIPDLDRNIADKLLILRLSDKTNFSFPNRGEITKMLKNQIPYFLRWLLHWTPPTKLTKGATRFGMRSYIHSKVRAASLSAGLDSDLLDIMEVLWANDDEFIKLRENEQAWEGSAAELFGVFLGNPMTSPMTKNLSPRGIGRKLSILATLPQSGVVREKTRTRVSLFKINPPRVLTANEESPAY